MSSAVALGAGLSVLQRGWLSSNNVLLDGPDGATLIDSGHCTHAAQTVALVRQRIGEQPLLEVINTHLHSDHCGGNAALQSAWACRVRVPSGSWQAVRAWDEEALGYASMRQRIERFSAHEQMRPGQTLPVGKRQWQVLAAPGHDPQSVMLFDAEHGVLISADALWENGFGLIFPELEGESAFDDAARVLDLIDTLPVRVVIPGHGAPFTDLSGALQRARSRLAGFRVDPVRHHQHAAKVLLKYHLMEEQQQELAALRRWMQDTPLMQAIWSRLGQPLSHMDAWCEQLLQGMLASGLLSQREGSVHDA